MPAYPVQELAEDIARSMAPEEFDRAAYSALGCFDQITERAAVQVACHEGCSLCCSLRVDVFAHDVFLVVHHIRAHFRPAEISELLVRLAGHAARVSSLTPFEHATSNNPCPLLREGRCSVYAARPHSCRRHHSLDFAACQFTYDHPTDLEAPSAHDRPLYRALTEAMQQNIDAYSTAEFDHTIYELGTAVHEALTDPSCWERWRRHELAFLRASITPAA